MNIYTGRGDKGETDLMGGKRVPKTSKRIEAYGSIDEVNASIGHAYTTISEEEGYTDIREDLHRIQNLLFKAQADLANPDTDTDSPRIEQSDIEWLEHRCDAYTDELPELNKFILPGGSKPGALLHVSRTICRRAERRIAALNQDEETGNTLRFMNRLSDLIYQIARTVNHRMDTKEENPSY